MRLARRHGYKETYDPSHFIRVIYPEINWSKFYTFSLQANRLETSKELIKYAYRLGHKPSPLMRIYYYLEQRSDSAWKWLKGLWS
jgi:hypothetical protein